MLEYLLLRPRDMDLFATGEDSNGGSSSSTRPTCTTAARAPRSPCCSAGCATGLRRTGRIQCIATSATVGGDRDPSAVTRFASNLFGQPFEWVDGDPDRQDLVMATRVEAPAGPFWGPLSAADYQFWSLAPIRLRRFLRPPRRLVGQADGATAADGI